MCQSLGNFEHKGTHTSRLSIRPLIMLAVVTRALDCAAPYRPVLGITDGVWRLPSSVLRVFSDSDLAVHDEGQRTPMLSLNTILLSIPKGLPASPACKRDMINVVRGTV